jgi:hypothetical protein
VTIERDLAQQLLGLGPSQPVRRRQGVIDAVNTDGTVDVVLGDSGVVVPGMRYMAHYSPVAGDTVFVEFVGSDPVVTGPMAAASATPGAWRTWEPAIAQNGARTVTVTKARFTRLHQQTIVGHMQVTVTNAGTAGNVITSSLPDGLFGNTGLDLVVGSFILFRAAGTRWAGSATWSSSLAAVAFIVPNTINALGVDPSFALANGDILSMSFYFEADGV